MVRLVQQTCGTHSSGFFVLAKIAREDVVCLSCAPVIYQTTRVLNDIGVSTGAIRPILERDSIFLWRWSRILRLLFVRAQHHVLLGLSRQSTVVSDDVRVATGAITAVVGVSWVVSSHHASLSSRVGVLTPVSWAFLLKYKARRLGSWWQDH